jgi:hypothetical protein
MGRSRRFNPPGFRQFAYSPGGRMLEIPGDRRKLARQEVHGNNTLFNKIEKPCEEITDLLFPAE